MKVIGVTGGIGSGKSLVANILKNKYGAYIVNTDRIAKEQMEPGGISYQGVVDYFGTGILKDDGTVDPEKLSGVVFKDRDKLMKLNMLTHPNVLMVVEEEIREVGESGNYPYFVIETALMIESGYDTICDEVWYVQSSPKDRRSRLKKERGYTDQKIDAIFLSQSKDEDFLRKYPIVIKNDDGIQSLKAQVADLLIY